MFTLPKSANHFSINTNSRDLDYQVSTKAIYQIIRNNPQGMTLTEIAQAVDPNWSTSNCKRMFKQAIDPLCLRDEVRFTVSSSGRRVKYFPVKISKRWLLNELFNQMINAWSSHSGNVNKSRVLPPLDSVSSARLPTFSMYLTLHDPVSFDTWHVVNTPFRQCIKSYIV